MNLSNIIIVTKMSKYELDMYKYKLTPDELIEKYKKENVDIGDIVGSHKRQKKSLKDLKNLFNEKQFISRDELTKEIAAKSDLIIALGGDNHFQYVSHFVDSKLIMGINSDPLKSEGALTYFTTNNFENILKKLEQENFDVEEWTKLEARLNRNPVKLAICEYFLGEDRRKYMSTYILEYKGKSEKQKNSGLLVATGAGSTGWYNSECRYIYSKGNKFSKTKDIAAFLATAPYRRNLTGYSMLSGFLEKGEELKIYSLNDGKGILTSDCVEDYNFNRGSTSIIKISDKKLRVVKNIFFNFTSY